MRRAFDASEVGGGNINRQQQHHGGIMRPQSAKVKNNQYNNNNNNLPQYQHQEPIYEDIHQQSYDLPQYGHNNNQHQLPPYPPQQPQQKVKFSARNGSADRLRPTKQKNNNFVNLSHNNDTNQTNITADYPRAAPKLIQVDKEKLYSDNLKLKNKLNDVQNENMRLKTKVSHLEKSYGKLERQLDEIHSTGMLKGGFKPATENNFLVTSLKKQLRESKEELTEKSEELNQLRKNIKCTRLQEVEVEKRAYEQETIRLKNMLDQALNQKMQIMIQESDYNALEEKCHQQNDVIENLKADNGELAALLKTLEDQHYDKQTALENLERKYQRDMGGFKRQLKDKNKEIESLRGQFSYRPNNNNNNNQSQLSNNNRNSPKKYSARPESAKPVSNSNYNNQRKENELREQLQQKEDQILDLQQQLDDMQLYRNQQNRKQDRQQEEVQKKQDQINLKPRIDLQDIKSDLGQTIKYKLQAQALHWNKVQSQYLNEQQFNITEIFSQEPFELSENQIDKLQTYIDQNIPSYQKYPQKEVLDCINPIIPQYKVWTPEEAGQIFIELTEILTNYKSLLETTFEMYTRKDDKSLITEQQLVYSFQQMDIELNQDQLDFLISSVILDSIDCNHLQYSRFFEIFKKDGEIDNISKQYSKQSYDEEDQYGNSQDQFYDSNANYHNKQINQHSKLQKGKNSHEENDIINKYAKESTLMQQQDEYDPEIDENIDDVLKKQENDLLGSWQDESENFDSQDQRQKQKNNNNKQQKQKQKQSKDDYDEYDQQYDDDVGDYEEEIMEDDIQSSQQKEIEEEDEAIVSDPYSQI